MTRPTVVPERRAARFWAKVDKSPGHGPNGDCWPWTGFIGTRGYGISANPEKPGTTTTAQRVALMLSGVDLAPGQCGCHTCDYPPCCRPDHLFAGTHKENIADMLAKGRANKARGGRHWQAKLTAESVASMRAAHEVGRSISGLAREYGVSPNTARVAIKGITWAHVTAAGRAVLADDGDAA